MSKKVISRIKETSRKLSNSLINKIKRKPDPKLDRCPNCKTELKGAFCYNCGQSTKSYSKPFSILIYDAFGDIMAFDTRLFKTAFPILFKPGFLTKEFFAGRRVRYVSPFKLYIFISFIAFLLIRINTNNAIETEFDKSIKSTKIDSVLNEENVNKWLNNDSKPVNKDSLYRTKIEKYREKIEKDSLLLINLKEPKDTTNKVAIKLFNKKKYRYNKYIKKNRRKLSKYVKKLAALSDTTSSGIKIKSDIVINTGEGELKINKEDADSFEKKVVKKLKLYNQNRTLFISLLLGNISKILFVLLPLFALLLAFFNIRRGFYFINHLIFSLHFHSFAFLYLFFLEIPRYFEYNLIQHFPWLLWIIPLYLLLSMKNFYNQGWGKTIGKFILLSFIYNIFLVAAIILALTWLMV